MTDLLDSNPGTPPRQSGPLPVSQHISEEYDTSILKEYINWQHFWKLKKYCYNNGLWDKKTTTFFVCFFLNNFNNCMAQLLQCAGKLTIRRWKSPAKREESFCAICKGKFLLCSGGIKHLVGFTADRGVAQKSSKPKHSFVYKFLYVSLISMAWTYILYRQNKNYFPTRCHFKNENSVIVTT